MTVRIGSNILSLNTQRQLGRASDDLSRASERLSSGQRINRASDDAAGLAISMSLRTNARIFSQGSRNLNDGVSALNIAESALDSLGSIAERIRELSAQAISGTFGDTQRQSMQREVTALQNEWNRTIESTSFNGISLLTGGGTRTVLQGGKGSDATLAVQIGEEQLANGIEGFAGGTNRVTTSSSGVEGNGNSYATSLSADGRYVVFESTASNLVASDTNGVSDVFLKDTATGTVIRVSTSSSGTEGNASSSANGVSADGRFVLFESTATNLVSGDTNGIRDVFVKDTLSGTTTRVSTSSSGAEANGSYTTARAISSDGRYVVFDGSGGTTNLVANDTNGVVDGFMKDLVTGITTRITTTANGAQASGGDSSPTAISADGRFVAFISSATNLVTGDTNGVQDGFIKDTISGTVTRVTTDSTGGQLSALSTVTSISSDGRYVGFWSTATNLVSGDTNGVRDAFVKDTVTNQTIAVSVTSSGTAGNAQSAVFAISADGRYVGFDSSASDLVSGDTNGVRDAFVRDIITGTTTRVSLSTNGTQANGASYAQSLSADGRIVLFQSSGSNLISGDSNGVFDSFTRDLTKVGVQQMSGMVVANSAAAKTTFDLIQGYGDELIQYRAGLGSTTSRITTFLNTLRSAEINTIAAESRISDTDVAQDSASAVAARIRQEIAASLLGQANQAPRVALQLLQGA